MNLSRRTLSPGRHGEPNMFSAQLAHNLKIISETDGSAAKYRLPVLTEALNAKSCSIYVMVHSVDGDTRVSVSWAHGPQFSATLGPDSKVWAVDANPLFDSLDSAGISEGMNVSSSTTDITRADVLAPAVEVEKISAGSGQKTATVSVWAVLKPF